MDIRVATFNASLNRAAPGELLGDLSTSNDAQARAVAEIIQRTDADVILINEFDYDSAGEAAALFQENYLGVAQNGANPVAYPYVYVAPSNTGVPSGFDLDNSGAAGDFAENDAFGFGLFEGQFSFVVYSMYPIDTANIRTFQTFLWKDMPGNLLTEDPTDQSLADFYSPEAIDVLRLSSKNHVDLPILVDGEIVHLLAAHPTPPVFDGVEDRNGKRNHDEIRFWADYVQDADYIYDDAGTFGGLPEGARFVIVGDYNADAFDGDSFGGAANLLLDNPVINGSATDPAITPESDGGPAAAAAQNGANDTHLGNPAFDTADFGFNPDDPTSDLPPGNLRVDYALPSEAGLAYLGGRVFWQAPSEPLFPLAEFPTSDHRLVYVDLALTDDDRATLGPLDLQDGGADFRGVTEIASFTEFEGTTVGGLSGIVYDAASRAYFAVSDDRDDPRTYKITIDLSDGALDAGDVEILGVTDLTLPGGAGAEALLPDLEGIALGEGGQAYLSSERNIDGRIPQILTVSDSGVIDGTLPIDAKFLGSDEATGVRTNLGFESLTISPDRRTLWTATESALTQDGPASTLAAGSAARIVRYDLETGQPVAEYVYEVDPIAAAPDPEGAFADSGLVELLALDNQGTLLALERSFSTGAADRGYTGKLFLVRTSGATDVSGEDSLPVALADGALEIGVDAPVQKTLIADLGDLGIAIDNIEGMTLGPVLPDGTQSLIIVSDDNFSAFGPQASQFIALSLDLGTVPTVAPVLETPDEPRYTDPADLTEGPDSDDPAVWLNPDDPAASVVVTAMKNGGLRVYDLNGAELQRIEPEGIRYNNVDVLYDVGRGKSGSDLAIASDRANDTLAIFRIDEDGTLTEATSRKIPGTIFGIDDGEATAYGLAAYTSPVDGKDYVFVTQADGNHIAQLEIVKRGRDFSFDVVRMLELPVPEGAEAADYQAEGIAIDRETGIGYVAVEKELGLLSFEADPEGSDGFTTVASIENFEPDIEGVTIHYGNDGAGLILVSSQGDSTFRAYDRADPSTYLGSFAIRGSDGIDGVEESDGAETFSGALPGFENGLLITQDGSNEPQIVFPEPGDGEVQNWNTNFKFTDLGDVLDLFGVAANPDFDLRALDPQTLPNGAASGDVTENSAILWARSLALGRITFTAYEIGDGGGELHEVARIRTEVEDTDLPVKVALEGLDPGKDYVYEVEDAAGAIADGRFSTPENDGHNGVSFGITGDWRGDLAPYPAISNAAGANLDFMLLGGDTIYADFASPASPPTLELEGFRTKYQEVYGTRSDQNYWEELRASTAIYAIIDDHEVVNDFAGGGLAADDPRFPESTGLVNDTAAFEEGLQAFHEYHPLEERYYGDTGDDRTAGERDLYRAQSFGQDAAVMILDQRSFRDDQIGGVADPTDTADVARFQTESFDPARTLLGAVQLDRLKADLVQAQADGVTWKFVYAPEPIQDLGLNNADSWEGYKAERTELLSFIEANGIDNVVFVAADIHGTFVNNLTYAEAPLGPQIATSAWEITTGSVAFDPAFGPAVIGAISGTPLLTPEQKAFYDSLPIAPDNDGVLNDKDDFIRNAFNTIAIAPLGLDPLGLDDNLAGAEGLIDATLLQGGWVSAHTYGWTEFEIDPNSQVLTVTTWGIPGYTPEDAAANAEAVPQIVSQFEVNPTTEEAPDMSVSAMIAPLEGYSAEALFTIGESIGAYTPPGVLDGLGAYAWDMSGDGADDTVRVLANHELLNSRGYAYEVSDGTGGTFEMVGARVSYFDIDMESREIVDAGLAYDTIVDATGTIASDTSFLLDGFGGFSRFCSSVLIEAEQFGRGRGLEDRIYFTGEEDGGSFNPVGGAEWALDPGTGTMYQIPAMGRGAWENITQIDTGDRKHVAFILSDDTSPFDVDGDGEDEAAPLFLYVGEKDRKSDDFLARNGLDDGKLYVWVADPDLKVDDDKWSRSGWKRWDDNDDDDGRHEGQWREGHHNRDDDDHGWGRHHRGWKCDDEEDEGPAASTPIDSPLEFNGTGNSVGGRWVEIDNAPRPDLASEDGSTSYDEYGYPTQRNLWTQAEAVGAFGFSRPEDVATNPEDGAEFVLASTGVDTYDVDPESGDGADSFGTIYTMEVDFKHGTPMASVLKIAYDGDDDPERALRSPDNLDWADDGFVYVQEDRAETETLTGEPLFGDGAANPNEAGVVKLNAKTGEVERIANIDRSVVLDPSTSGTPVDVDAGTVGAWESSGIVDVSDLFGEAAGSLFLLDVQAHGIEGQDAFNPDSRITDSDLVEGGQLLFLQSDDLIYV